MRGKDSAARRHVHEHLPKPRRAPAILHPMAPAASAIDLNACGNRPCRWLELGAGRGPR
jgi:hypothetical protein